MKRALFLVVIALFCFSAPKWAQSEESITDDGKEVVNDEERSVVPEEKGISYNMWSDPLYYQFEKMMPPLARSIGRLDNRISTLAVVELDFSENLDRPFRNVASAKLYGQLLLENPRLKLIKCDECDRVRSEIKNGILTISRGLASQEQRKQLAEKLGVQGFMTAMIIEEKRQLTIVVKVYDAMEGRIILSDVITGIPVAETSYWNVYIGQATFPITMITNETISHFAKLIGIEYTKRFSESWMLSTNFAMYLDNNSKLETPHTTISTGFMFDGAVGYELMSFMNNDAAFILMGGIGQFLSPQYNFSIYGKAGIKIIVNKLLTFNIHTFSFGEKNMETPDSTGKAIKLVGTGTTIAFGVQF